MKKVSLSILPLIALLGPASAADLPSRKTAVAPQPAPATSWNGLYFGLNLGGGWAQRSGGGVVGGGQIGYNYQLTPLFVVGLESDFQGTSLSLSGRRPPLFVPTALGAGAVPPFTGAQGGGAVPWFGTVRGRVGVLALGPSLLLYGTGGFAYAGAGGGVATGWTAGGGAEWAFARNWSAKAEYLFNDVSGGGAGGPGGATRDVSFHVVRVGVNYRFDAGDLLGRTKF
ncbi:outer membrane protein [Methylocystis heyeri]|uniref:Outer membrane beta-barrel protein n=1 Tax=Methylocystis heyeri TaxID=391905 RepID=A0A6B8KJQ5_9HYPH|nr:outer membrane beta-barrel protein [Methylocystis heyeri]QGM47311.1 outer membrane beta-barrel protein [Methylocystis heyeri]